MKLSNCVIDLYHGDAIDPSNGFHAMQADGVVAIIHKATEGLQFTDSEYHSRAARAKSTGILWGAYHFGTGEGTGKAQADKFLSVVNPGSTDALALDFEPNTHGGNMSLAQAEDFVNEVHKQVGRYPLLYTVTSYCQPRLKNKQTVLSKCGLWIARYNSAANPGKLPGAWSDFVLWQYTDGQAGSNPHRVAGVLQPLDRDFYQGSVDDLKKNWPL